MSSPEVEREHPLRLHRNCHTLEDFQYKLIKRFQEKGYQQKDLVKLKTEIMKMYNNALFIKKTKKKENKMDMNFITGYNMLYQVFEHIMTKYCPILKEDRVLSKILPMKLKLCSHTPKLSSPQCNLPSKIG